MDTVPSSPSSGFNVELALHAGIFRSRLFKNIFNPLLSRTVLIILIGMVPLPVLARMKGKECKDKRGVLSLLLVDNKIVKKQFLTLLCFRLFCFILYIEEKNNDGWHRTNRRCEAVKTSSTNCACFSFIFIFLSAALPAASFVFGLSISLIRSTIRNFSMSVTDDFPIPETPGSDTDRRPLGRPILQEYTWFSLL